MQEMNDILAMFNAKYGTDLEPRLGKLDEEITELKEAISNYFDQLDYGDTDTSDITDEMGDVLAVMTKVLLATFKHSILLTRL